MRKYNIINMCIVVAGLLLLNATLGACTSYDYDEEMNDRFKEEARLKVEDEKIKAEITASIKSLHEELMQNIGAMSQRVDGSLSKKDKEVMDRFTKAENELRSLIETRAKQADTKIENLGATLGAAIKGKQELFDKALLKARQELEKAIKDGDDANIKKAQDGINLIKKTEDAVMSLGNDYELRINRLLALESRLHDMRAEIEKKEAEKVRILKQAQDFENHMKDVIDQKIQHFRSTDLAKIKNTLSNYNNRLAAYINLDNYNLQLESLSSDVKEITDKVQDAIDTAENLVNMSNDAATALDEFNTLYDEMEALHNEAESAKDDALSKVQDNLDIIENDLEKLEDIRDEIQGYIDEIENLDNFMQECVDDAESEAGSVNV